MKKRLLKALLVIVALGLLLLMALAIDIYRFGERQSNFNADAAIVLGAAVWSDRLSPVFKERVNHAIKLYQHSQVKKLIFTGGQGEKNEPAESMAAREYAIKAGVAADDILVETASHTTYQNIYFARQVAEQAQLKKILIVSDPLHMRRAIWIARDLGMEAYPSPTETSRYQSFSSKIEFIGHETYFSLSYVVRHLFALEQ